ncbi:hypothetical protein [Serratia marcescens]|uniref:hypothetical protein n=1 Tax=Serratia marcescens TaxID=615 RepID=UPI00124E9A97|nr:hypothetical protein [Serratia marcescens]QFH59422.1 hypothetical protein FR888_08905 [Serratia marcescens]
MTLTIEELKYGAEVGDLGIDAVRAVCAEALANREAQPVAWEMRYWNSGYNCWHDWERITAQQHAEMSAEHASDNDYEFRVLYVAPPAPAAPDGGK